MGMEQPLGRGDLKLARRMERVSEPDLRCHVTGKNGQTQVSRPNFPKEGNRLLVDLYFETIERLS